MKSNRPDKKLLTALFAIYLIILIWVVVFKCNNVDALHIEKNASMTLIERLTFNAVPFKKMIEAIGRDWRTLEIPALIFNVVCFIPFGILMMLFTDSKRASLAVGASFSLCVEVFQLFSCWGGVDSVDLIMNTSGTAIGIALYGVLRKRIGDQAINRIASVLIALCAPLAIFAIVNSVIHFPSL